MTYPASNSPKNSLQAGVTLLLSVLLLAAITTIAFSLAAVGFAEINTSNDLARTEPILYHSLGVAEEGTYGMKRGVTTVKNALGGECNSSGFVNYNLDNQSFGTKTKYCNINSEKDIEVIVPTNTYRTATRLYIYDPANNGTASSGYSEIRFRKSTNNTGTVQLYMCPLTTECVDPSVSLNGWQPRAGTNLQYNVWEIVPVNNNSYEIVLINSGPKEFVNIITAPKGLPYLNKEAIEIQSSFGRLIRRLRVLVPTQ